METLPRAPKVLLIEDNRHKAEIYERQMTTAGIESESLPDSVDSFDELVEWAKAQTAASQFDAIVIDLDLKQLRSETHSDHELDGLEVYCRLLKTSVLDRCGQVIVASRLFSETRSVFNAPPGCTKVFMLKVFLAAAGISEKNIFSLVTGGGYEQVVARIREIAQSSHDPQK